MKGKSMSLKKKKISAVVITFINVLGLDLQAGPVGSSSNAPNTSSGASPTQPAQPAQPVQPTQPAKPTQPTTSVDDVNFPDEYSNYYDPANKKSNNKNEMLELLSGGGSFLVTALSGTALMLFQGRLTKKTNDILDRKEENYHKFFPSDSNRQEEAENFLNQTIVDFKKIKEKHTALLYSGESEKAGALNFSTKKETAKAARINEEEALLNKMEQHIANAKATTYQKFIEQNLIAQKQGQKINGNEFSDNEFEGEDIRGEYSNVPRHFGEEDKQESIRIIKSEIPRLNEKAMVAHHLNVYYSSKAQGENRQDLLKRPEVAKTVHEGQKEFARAIINTPAIFNNLSESTQGRMRERAQRKFEPNVKERERSA